MAEFKGLETHLVDGDPLEDSVSIVPIESTEVAPQERSTEQILKDGDVDEAIGGLEKEPEESEKQTDAEPDKEKLDGKKEKEPEKDPPWYEKRISKFTKQKYELLERVEREREAREKLEAELKQLRDERKAQEESKLDALINAPEPNPENYTTDTAYYKDYALWAMRKENAERDKSQRKPEPITEVDPQYVSRERIKSAIVMNGTKSYDDFEETVLRNTGLNITPIMVDAMGEEDNAADIAYYFGKNPDIADKIAKLPALSAAKEIGKISVLISKEESLSQEPDPNTNTIKKQSSAPEPITPIGGRAPVKKPLDKMTNEEYRAARGFTKDAMRKG